MSEKQVVITLSIPKEGDAHIIDVKTRSTNSIAGSEGITFNNEVLTAKQKLDHHGELLNEALRNLGTMEKALVAVENALRSMAGNITEPVTGGWAIARVKQECKELEKGLLSLSRKVVIKLSKDLDQEVQKIDEINAATMKANGGQP